jgi:hypothetical protein
MPQILRIFTAKYASLFCIKFRLDQCMHAYNYFNDCVKVPISWFWSLHISKVWGTLLTEKTIVLKRALPNAERTRRNGALT